MAILTRLRPADHPELIEAKREHAVLAIEEFALNALASAPPLYAEQRARLAALFAASAEESA